MTSVEDLIMSASNCYSRALTKHATVLSHEEQRDLAYRVREGDELARERLINANLLFVVKLANAYKSKFMSTEDLISAGNEGLIEAVDRYDPDRGTKFINYATWWVKRRMLQCLADQNVVNVPVYQQNLERNRRKLEGAAAREGEELIVEPETSVQRRAQAVIRGGVVSIDRPDYDGVVPAQNLRCERPTPYAVVSTIEDTSLVREGLHKLSPQENLVLSYRYGLNDRPILLQREIGERIGVSGVRVGQLETQAKKRLAHLISNGKVKKRRATDLEGRLHEGSARLR